MKKSILKSILVSLLLIGMLSLITGCFGGIEIYNNAKDVAEEGAVGMNALAVEGFNAQFENYKTDSASVAVVNRLIRSAVSNNTNYEPKIKIKYISQTWESDIEPSAEIEDLNNIINLLNSEKKYKIELSEYSKNGCISLITITEL